MNIAKNEKSKNDKEILIPEGLLDEIVRYTKELKALQTEELNRYKSNILKEIHEIRQWNF